MRRRTIFVSAAGVAAGSLLTACTGDAKPPAWTSPSGTGSPNPNASPAPDAAAVTFVPAHGTANFSPAQPVVVKAVNATLQQVTVTSGDKVVAGALDATKQTW